MDLAKYPDIGKTNLNFANSWGQERLREAKFRIVSFD